MSFIRTRLLSTLALCALLAGCGVQSSMVHVEGADTIVSGHVHGGQQPVSGATIQLYTIGTTGDGSASTPLLTQTVTSDANGNFGINKLYSCSSATLVYITATGGFPGTSSANPNLALMTAIGPCSSLTASTFISINEETTVAAVSALSPYMSSLTAIGSGTTDVTALTSAFSLASQYVDPSLGTSPGNNVPTGYTVPTALINTLSDVLASCINSTGGTAGDSSACGQLFSMTTVTNGTAPTNTIAALLNLASNPTLNTAGLYGLASPTGPFQPQVTAQPASFAVRLSSKVTPALQVSPLALTFAENIVGTPAASQMVTLTNTGATTVSLGSIGIAGMNASDFNLVSGCGGTLLASATCTIQVKLTPSAAGGRSGYISIASSAPESPQYVTMTGAGVTAGANIAVLSINSLAFTAQYGYIDVSVLNYGQTPIPIGPITITDPSFNQRNTCGATLLAQSACTITVQSTGTPALSTAGGKAPLYAGTLTINEGAAGAQTIALGSANIYIFPPVPAASVVQVPVNQTPDTIFYEYYYDLPTSQPAAHSGIFTGPNANDFSFVKYMDNGSYVDFYFNFTPSAAGTRVAHFVIDTQGQYFPVTGVGYVGPAFQTPSAVSLYATLASDNTAGIYGNALQLVNVGTSTVHLSVGALTGPGAANFTQKSDDGNNCAAISPAPTGDLYGSCDFIISFATKTGGGTYTATLPITDLDTNVVYNVPYTATIRYTPFTTSTSSLSFTPVNGQPLGTTSASQTIAVYSYYAHTITATLPSNSNFVLSSPACNVSLSISCKFSITFAPVVAGSIVESLTLTDTTSGQVLLVPLTGLGGEGSLAASAASVTFPARLVNTVSVPMQITLTNTGPIAVNMMSISVSGAVNNNFTQTNSCTSIPSNGGTCTISVTFAPTVMGLQSVTLTITPYPQVPAITIPISGTTQ